MAVFTGQPGNDVFAGTDAVADRFLFNPANLSAGDVVSGGLGVVNDIFEITAMGSISAGQLAGVSGIEVIKMFAGSLIEINDALVGSSRLGLITIAGTAGNDKATGGDVFNAGNRLAFRAGAGNDVFVGGAGADAVTIGAADLSNRDVFTGGGGVDKLTIASSGVIASNALSNVFGFEHMFLNAGGNTMTLGQDTVGTAAGRIVTVAGGNGDDTLDASSVGFGRVVFNAGGGANTFYGTAGNDKATGGDGADELNGNGGNDTLSGGTGDNILNGGAGKDTIIVGFGSSTISGGAGADTITTFKTDSSIDTLAYSAPSEGGDLVVYNDGSGPGLGSAGAVDTYFFNNYFASNSVGAFFLDYNPDTFTATLY